MLRRARRRPARALPDPMTGEGKPASQLARHVVDNGIELVVLGLPEESAPTRRLAGSAAEPCCRWWCVLPRAMEKKMRMQKPKIALRLCARRYMSHCPEG